MTEEQKIINRSVLKMLQKEVMPKSAEALRKNLERMVMDCKAEHLPRLVSDMQSFYEDLQKGTVYSSYISLSRKKYDDEIRTGETFRVDYNGPYDSFGDALADFRKQSGIPVSKLVNVCGVSPKTIKQYENNQPPTRATGRPKASQARWQEERARARILAAFDIHPPEKRDELEKLPIYKETQ